MTSVLIVDDEQIEREGLAAILRKGFPDLAIEQARNGRVALQMVEEGFRPDLVLMDIKMPGMDGLETIERISAIEPDIRFIMVTAYDAFDYARTAIKLGVKDYLLKPSKADEIIATVGRVLRQIEEERKEREASRQQITALKKVLPVVETDIVTQLLYDHVHDVHLDELVDLLGVSTASEMFAIVVMMPAGEEQKYAEVKARIRKTGVGLVGALSGGQIPVIVFRDPVRSYRSQATTLARELLALAASGGGAGWFIGIGGVCGSLDDIRQSYHEAQIAAMDPTLPVKYRFYEDTPALGAVGGRSDREWEKRFIEQIRTGDWERVQEGIMSFIRRCEQEGVDLLLAQQRALELIWLVSRMLQELGVEVQAPVFPFQAQDYRRLQAEAHILIGRLRQAYAEHQARHEPDAVHQIKKYIIEHSHEDISLEAIGRMIGLSPFYISKLFKEQFGINYIDFLTECRIEKAKKLMADPELSMKVIALEVGYRDPNYFSKVFKKMCNISPTEYRKALLGTRGREACDA
ncbi:Two component transcriptional regulator, AraC family [Thermobacillus xylanilyticus]|uniref:Two component transcriptional regulator, AraC family n=1 Tax=Thermobacillus xylanilyticus TaxID=76633 RepID=A0ABM8V8Z8_THEXY|nr:response regulator [Thermobacillus xylanilyticus]CAG5092846.1 Two component transcriptional regulator, AraC family [Thermobacillus xylanilyticus]